MRKTMLVMACTTMLVFSGVNVAEEVRHYEGKSVESLTQALAYFRVYNEEFGELLEGELTPETMARIHKMSYTMENALGRINAEMDELTETLEAVHLASETADTETVAEQGRIYLETANAIVGTDTDR